MSSVSKCFPPSTVAVDGLDLDVADGEFLVLLGPSGCGKSTALRLIAGLERPDAGTISIGDRCVDDVAAEKRNVAMVFQSYALYPHMSVGRNIDFSLRPLNLSRADRRREVAQVAEQLELTDLLERKPRQLSGGQQQRVALARALVRRPSVFLMDEPLSNLDVQLRTRTRAELVQLQHRLGTTVVYVTHDQVEALTMADRIAVLDGGRLQQLGSPADVYDRPANTFVAAFVGFPPMNLWPAVVDDLGEVTVADVAIGRTAIGAAHARKVIVGVRPESVRLLDCGLAGLPATVDWLEDLGHEQLLGGSLACGQPFSVRWADPAEPPRRGSRVRLRPDSTALHCFDATTGERI